MAAYEVLDTNRKGFTSEKCTKCNYDGGWSGNGMLTTPGDPPGHRTAVCKACGTLWLIKRATP